MKKDFESRFIANVKFVITPENSAELIEIVGYDKLYSYYGGCTNSDGSLISLLCTNKEIQLYELQTLKEVSIYEAIPELIPDGMRYNKELDKLVPNLISAADEYCSGIKVEFEKVADYTKENISCKNEKSKHYEIWKDFEAIDVLKNCLNLEEYIGFLKGNILKYQLRLGKKDDVSKEIEKIKDYKNELDFILKELNVK